MSARQPFSAQVRAFPDHREAALALLSDCVTRGDNMPARTASFLGTCCAYESLTPRMERWLVDLLRKAGLPPIAGRG